MNGWCQITSWGSNMSTGNKRDIADLNVNKLPEAFKPSIISWPPTLCKVFAFGKINRNLWVESSVTHKAKEH